MPVTTLAGWLAGLIVAVAVGAVIHGLLTAASVEGAVGAEYRMAFIASVAAVGWVAGALAAPPRRRWIAAVILFGIGGWVAWSLLGWWYFPEDHPRAYQTSLVPVMGAWLGGLLATSIIVIRDALTSRRSTPREMQA